MLHMSIMNAEEHEKLLKKILYSQPESCNYYDRRHNPLDVSSWHKLLNDKVYKIVSVDDVENVTISTMWFGHKSVMFSTTIYRKRPGYVEIIAHCIHDTEKEALWLHNQLIFLFDQKLWCVDENV